MTLLHAIRTGSWWARVAPPSATTLKFLQRGLQAGIRDFKSKGGVKFAVVAAAIAASLSLAPMPADGMRTRHLPYPQLAFPLVINGSQYAPLAWADITGWSDDDHLAAYKAFRTSCKAIVAQTGTAYSMPGKWWSDVYMALPLTFNGPSTRGRDLPITDGGADCVVGTMSSPYVDWVACFSA